MLVFLGLRFVRMCVCEAHDLLRYTASKFPLSFIRTIKFILLTADRGIDLRISSPNPYPPPTPLPHFHSPTRAKPGTLHWLKIKYTGHFQTKHCMELFKSDFFCLWGKAGLLGSPRAHLHVVGMLRFSDINQHSLPTPFYSALVSTSVFEALSTVFHYIHSPDSSPLSPSALPGLCLPCWSFQLYISL